MGNHDSYSDSEGGCGMSDVSEVGSPAGSGNSHGIVTQIPAHFRLGGPCGATDRSKRRQKRSYCVGKGYCARPVAQ
jgi:hypothetical protein